MPDEPIPSLGFHPPDAGVPGFEIVDLATLHARMRRPGGLHRVDFHSLTLVTAGTGTRTVDFVTHPCRPGTLLWVRPGQVQGFGDIGTADGAHLMFTPAFPPAFSGVERVVGAWSGPVCRQLGTSPDHAVVADFMGRLRAEFDRPPETVSPEILRLQLAVLLLHVDRLPGPGTDPRAGGEIYTRFRAELERRYATVRRAEDYAQRLGYSVRTLSRACLAATGQPVKQVIDGRVVLEAQRLLAHTGEPVAVIARRLGFSEPTNFGKFFTRRAGVTPGEFRDAHR
ncbi:AraC family transcriptional regulator [Amycolatopsis sp. NPDC021455]|uniref:helix-turn-helix domain-containing protein n=1 Tax=Amycolatopsis sp. NPDC021455 TaxID=3154901 RepID=UPI0033E34C24